ncbi:glycoside hydrolase family 15 protein [Paxillus ammoniavirescens]|nr:glycoside hydrolase family 15 protein [Paxillus ammoniavirescens]
MRPFIVSALTLGLCAASESAWAQSGTVDQYITTESPIARAGVLANIGPDGSKSSGAYRGIVIASPSTANPNYLYTWVRDSCLVFKELIDQYTSGQNTTLRTLIDSFITAETKLQQVPNPSGTVSTGGLGEPKFNIDGSAFTGSWGRPQRDGPALRSTAVITYANWLIADGNLSYVTNTLWPMIQLDLDYVANNWNKTTFDLWEELDLASFFTTAVQHRALRQGIALANAIGQTSVVSGYTTQAQNSLCFLQSYWNPSPGYMTANAGGGLSGVDENTPVLASNPSQGYMTANTEGGRSGIDLNAVLASVHTFDVDAGCDATTFQPCSDKALSNLKTYVDSFRTIYSINFGIPANQAVATGRYSEDVYQGGNPWYLATFAVAEQLYDALTVWDTQGYIEVTSTSLGFFQQFNTSIIIGTYTSSSSTYTSLITAIQSFADGFVATAAKYTPSDGGLAEQYSRFNGEPLSAVDLTWNYASALTAFAARAGQTSASWGAQGLVAPGSCLTSDMATVSVQFNVDATTLLGENIYLTGSVGALSNWDASTAILLSSANYPTWSTTVNLPANTAIKYKYIRIYNGAVTWEPGLDNTFATVASGAQTLHDSWQ